MAQPGAVPQSLSKTVQFSGRYACFSLLGVIFRPMVSKNARMRASEGSCSTSFAPKTSAQSSLVRSS